MSLAGRIDRATLLLYIFGISGLVFGPLDWVPWRSLNLFSSGIVTYAIQLDQTGNGSAASSLKVGATLAFFVLAFAVHRRMLWATIAALAFVAFDGIFLFIFSLGVWSGLFGSLQVGFHVFACWSLADAGVAIRQWRTNDKIAERLGVEADLRRKLDDSQTEPPPPASFTRYSPAPRPSTPELKT